MRMNAFQKKAAGELRTCAALVGRVVSKLSSGFRDDGDDLRELIARQERQHRRFAPAGYRHTFPLSASVDYFMVRIFADAVRNPDATAAQLDGMREDYLKARLIMTRKAYDRQTGTYKTARELFAETVSGLVEMADRYDYVELVHGKSEDKKNETAV